MKKLKLLVELEFDEYMMYGCESNTEAVNWFYEEILKGKNLLLFENEDIGDTIGKIKVLEIKDN